MAFADIVKTAQDKAAVADPAKAKGVNAVFQFELSGDDGGSFYLNVNDGSVEVAEGVNDGANVTILMSAEDYLSMMDGKLNSTSAFMAGKLKIKGDMSLAMKLQAVIG